MITEMIHFEQNNIDITWGREPENISLEISFDNFAGWRKCIFKFYDIYQDF